MSELNKILYAEDEPDIQEVAQMALDMMGGFTIHTCNNGEEAVKAALEFAPDLMLFDVMMPSMDGPTALQEIRKLPGMETTPVIFMTAKVQNHEIQEYKDMGAIDVIAKPFDPMTLAEEIQAIWARHQ